MQEIIRRLRHDLRGQLNTMMLCTAVLPITTDQSEQLQFLDEICKAADQAMRVLNEFDKIPPEAFAQAPGA